MSGAVNSRYTATILLVDDDPSILKVLELRLKSRSFRVLSAPDGQCALNMADESAIDLAVIDYKLEDCDGMSLMEKLWERQQGVPVIILTAYGTIDKAVEAMRRGACHYLTKPFDGEDLVRQIDLCLERSRLASQEFPADDVEDLPEVCRQIIARSSEMKELLAKAAQIAITDSNVYIEGESGTGKELIARCIHAASKRNNGPFVAINCAAIPENLIESELLGYEKGAFTGADTSREGLFARADGGSFFFDELAEMPLPMQAKLLRILEEREFYPLGSRRKVKVDVRIIAASNRNLEKLMHDGLFREDLYYRIRVIPISLPPLRKRKEDIPLLANHFLARFSRKTGKPVRDISPSAMQKLMAAEWPGNVRELENVLEYAVAMTVDEVITPDLIVGAMPAEDSAVSLQDARKTFEKEYLVQLLERNNGNVSQAAKAAGKYRADFYTLLRKHGLDPEDFRRNDRNE